MKLRRAALTGSSSPLPARTLWYVAGVYFGLTTVIGFWLWQRWGGAFTTRAVDDIGSLLGILFAAGCAGLAARSACGRIRRGWLAMAAGLLGWAVGEAIWGFYEVGLQYEQAPYPSLADAFYLLYPVGAGVAVVFLSTGNNGPSRIRLILDGLIVAASLFLVSWVTVIESVFHAGGDSHLALTVSLAYPIADVVIITIAWASTVVAYRPSMGLLVAGLIIVALSDSVFTAMTAVNDYFTGSLIDLGWLAGSGVLGLAALRSIGEPPREETLAVTRPRARQWLVYLPVLLAICVGMTKILPLLNSIPFAATVLVLTLAVLARQLVALAENQRLLADVGRLAFMDQLTGVANRALFLDRLDQAVKRQRREPLTLTVLCLDLDGFKAVNDDLGHPAGDELLIRVAERLSASVRGTDTVARLGGDEFALLLEGPVEDTVVAAERIVDSFAEPIVVDGVALAVRPSVGLTLATADMSQTTVNSLVRQADLAMYAAKRDGGGCLRSFVPDLPNPYELPGRSPIVVEPPAMPEEAATTLHNDDGPEERRPEGVPEQPRSPPLGVRVTLIALLAGLVVFALSTVLRERPGRSVLIYCVDSALLLSAAGLVAARSWRVAAERWPWLFIAAGMTASGLAMALYAVLVPAGQVPSIADPLSIAFYPLVFAGLLLLIRQRLRYVPRAVRFDAVVVGLTVAALTSALASRPVESVTSSSPATVFIRNVYPAAGLLLLGITAGSIAILGWRAERRWALLIAGIVLYALANTVYLFEALRGTYTEGTWIDAWWPAAFLLIAAAAWESGTHPGLRPKTGRAPLLLPVVCTIVALGVTLLADDKRLAVMLAALGLTAVAARFAVTFRDVSALAESHHQAMTDELTGLSNRLSVATALAAATFDEPGSTRWDRRGTKLGLVLLGLDQFQEISASLGRTVSDELRYRVANRLSTSVRPADLLARVGGDEFAVLLTQADLTTARAQAGALMDALRAPFALDHITVQVDASIGVALWPDHCAHPQELLGCAEAAMAHARTMTSHIAVYDATADLHTNHDGQFIADLRSMLAPDGREAAPADSRPGDDGHDADMLMCYYQPKIEAGDDSVHSVEALVRWRHPARGLLLPDQFLPAAEHAGLMRPVAALVLDMALAQIRSWRDQGITLTVAVNLSTTNLLDLGLVETIARLLRTHDLPAHALILEITESTLTTDSQRALGTVAALRRLGTRLSLDDYGTGWSSLARLQDLSVDELKLDRVFVARLARDPRSIAIVRSTVALAHSLGADLVAEGVEDDATLHALRRYGCNITQGNVHSPPLPPEEFQQWLLAHTAALASLRSE
jgi:diguanylate cyclase (GGDEF)-like protein